MTTALGYALLGLLARDDLSGYDLARRLKTPVGYFWQARHSQIYPELARLEAHGLVRHHVVPQQDRPDKKVYAITDAGRDALRAWVTQPAAVGPIRDELVLKTYSLWLADPGQAVALLREHQRHHAERLAEYEGIQAWLESKYGADLRRPGTPAFSTYLTLQRGISYEREYAVWCAWVVAQLEQADE